MIYKIEEIEGIGHKYGQKLRNAGVSKVHELLEKGASKKGRADLAKATEIDESSILTWVNHADLFRIRGIGPEFAELLEAAGVDTVKELRNRNGENLYAKIKEVNQSKRLVRRLPSEQQVCQMVEDAKALEPVVTY